MLHFLNYNSVSKNIKNNRGVSQIVKMEKLNILRQKEGIKQKNNKIIIFYDKKINCKIPMIKL